MTRPSVKIFQLHLLFPLLLGDTWHSRMLLKHHRLWFPCTHTPASRISFEHKAWHPRLNRIFYVSMWCNKHTRAECGGKSLKAQYDGTTIKRGQETKTFPPIKCSIDFPAFFCLSKQICSHTMSHLCVLRSFCLRCCHNDFLKRVLLFCLCRLNFSPDTS